MREGDLAFHEGKKTGDTKVVIRRQPYTVTALKLCRASARRYLWRNVRFGTNWIMLQPSKVGILHLWQQLRPVGSVSFLLR